MNEKRNSVHGIAEVGGHQQHQVKGVGGRQTPTPTPQEGGGYQNICTILNFDPAVAQKKRDPRLEELNDMGLQRIWLDIAGEIGVDNFLKVWRMLDSAPEVKNDAGRLLVPIRGYSLYLRYQRNRYAESLVGMGFSASEVFKKLREQLGEKVSMSTILRITKKRA